MRRLLAIASGLALCTAFAGAASAQNSNVLQLTNTGTTLNSGGSTVMSYEPEATLVLPNSGDSATYDIEITTNTGFSQFSFSASQTGAVISGTTVAVLDPGFGSTCFTCLVTPLGSPENGGTAMDAAGQWAGSANPPGPTGVLTAGTYTMGTITVAPDVDPLLQIGVLDAKGVPDVDGIYDPNFLTLLPSLSNASTRVRVVPEPGAAVLMLSMIGTIGWISRRERRTV